MDKSMYMAMPFPYKLARFCLLLKKAYPFLGELYMRVEKHHKMQGAIAATDGFRLYLNTDLLNELPEECLNFILLHELLHIILRHRYPKVMPFHEKIFRNIGFDLVANWLLMSMSGELKHKGLPIIPVTETMLCMDDLSQDPSDVIADAFIAQAAEQGILSEVPPLQVKIAWKSFETTVSLLEVYLFDVLDSADVGSLPSEAEILGLFADCEKTAGKHGLPWQLKGLWDELKKEKSLPWHIILRHYMEDMQESADVDFSPPDKRMLYRDLILPAELMDERTIGNALVVLDVSSSINRTELLAQIQHVNNLLKEFEIQGLIISFGTKVYQEAKLTTVQKLRKFVDDLEVGGGTNWGEVVSYVKQSKRHYKPIIVFTDGYFFGFDEGLPHVIFITQGDYPDSLRKLGRVIRIS